MIYLYLGLSETRQMHLLVEEVDHLLLGESEGDVAHVDSPRLARDGGAHHRHRGLRRVRHQGGRDLAALLHALILKIHHY